LVLSPIGLAVSSKLDATPIAGSSLIGEDVYSTEGYMRTPSGRRDYLPEGTPVRRKHEWKYNSLECAKCGMTRKYIIKGVVYGCAGPPPWEA
jgi:hypothetical protein